MVFFAFSRVLRLARLTTLDRQIPCSRPVHPLDPPWTAPWTPQVRHATYITDELAKIGLITALADALRDRNERLRRKAMAALGELLFYVATQQEEGAARAEASQWEVPASTVIHNNNQACFAHGGRAVGEVGNWTQGEKRGR
eukprot:1873531-Pyramimonas_sp.AAC.1